MQPQVAALLVTVSILGALIIDSRRKPRMSLALWLPLIWLGLLASRPLSVWLNPRQGGLGANVEEGSPVDMAFLSVLIVIAVGILLTRRRRWMQWVKDNPWTVVFFLYCGVTVFWSDFPLVAFKRWVRALGSVLMILVVLSEDDPIAAAATLVRRCTYVLVPLSILFIKYYRDRAVVYNEWTGEMYLVGVTTDKNALGRLCLVAGVFGLWDLVVVKAKELRDSKMARLVSIVVFLMTLWLLRESHSATSLGSFIVGAAIMLGLGVPLVRKGARFLGTFILIGASTVAVLALTTNLMEVAVGSLGRDMTFTDRTYIWQDLIEMRTNPVVGVGYDSFWLGDRKDKFVAKHQVYEAHNGYLEVYLELGFAGVFLLGCVVFSAFWKARRELISGIDYGRLRLVMTSLFLVYNITEAAYKATTLMFFVFLLVAIDFPRKTAVVDSEQAHAPVAPPMSFRPAT